MWADLIFIIFAYSCMCVHWAYTCSYGPCQFLNIGDTDNISLVLLHSDATVYCPSVCPSVMFRYPDHIGSNTSKIISPPNSYKIVTWRFLRNRWLILHLHTIFRTLIYWAHPAVIFAIAWLLVIISCDVWQNTEFMCHHISVLFHCRQRQCSRQWIRKTFIVRLSYVAGQLFHTELESMSVIGDNDKQVINLW